MVIFLKTATGNRRGLFFSLYRPAPCRLNATPLFSNKMKLKLLFVFLVVMVFVVMGRVLMLDTSTVPQEPKVPTDSQAPTSSNDLPQARVVDTRSVATKPKVDALPTVPENFAWKNPELSADPRIVKRRNQEEQNLHALQFGAATPSEK